jgi:hypothetical protein
MSVQHSPKDRKAHKSPLSANKQLLSQISNGGGDDDDDDEEEENEWTKVKPNISALVEFISETLPVSSNQGLLVFAQTLLESSGTEFLKELLDLERVKFPKPWLLHEILSVDVKLPTTSSRVLTKLKAISLAAEKLELDICDQLTFLQQMNRTSKSLGDFDFDRLAEYCQFVDGLPTSESRLKRKIEVTETIVVVVQGILEASITVALELGASKALDDDFKYHESMGDRLSSWVEDGFRKQDLMNASMSNQLDEITRCLQQLMGSAREEVGGLSRGSSCISGIDHSNLRPSFSAADTSKTEQLRAALAVQSKSSSIFNGHLGVKSESSHEAKATALHSGPLLAQLTSHTKGASIIDDCLSVNELYARQLPKTSASSVQFATSPNEIMNLLRAGQLILPGFNLIQHTTGRTSGSTDKVGRQIVQGKSGGLYVRELSLIQSLDKLTLPKELVTLINPAACLPKSLAHMVRFITEQIAGMKDGILHSHGPFNDGGMMNLIETCSATLIANFSEAVARLLDGIKTPCVSPEGHWRGLLQLFWHQYSRAFSSKRQDGCSIFYPEALNHNFQDNRDTLFSEYNWSTQLTMEIGNAMRLQCWRCNGSSDVSYQSCLSSECKKKRADEENLHVYLVKGSGQSGAMVASCKLSKA